MATNTSTAVIIQARKWLVESLLIEKICVQVFEEACKRNAVSRLPRVLLYIHVKSTVVATMPIP